jgi:integrase
LSVEDLRKIIKLPYEKEIVGGRRSRFNLAKDVFLLSFGLIGMNSADLFSCKTINGDVITYNRQKTAGRREDGAEMKVRIEPFILPLFEKYRDPDNERVFNFHKYYSDHKAFNKNLNIGLKKIGAKLDIEDLEFYAARHSWATIARSAAVGIDKATVHEALNHVDSDMKVTDIYIDRDWSVIWNANRKVINFVVNS